METKEAIEASQETKEEAVEVSQESKILNDEIKQKNDALLEELKLNHDVRVMVGTSFGIAVKESKVNPLYKYYAIVRYKNNASESSWLIDKNLYAHPEAALLRAMGLSKIGDQEQFSELATRLLGLPEV